MYESLGVLSSLRVASLSCKEGLNRLNIYKYMHISYCIFGIYNVNSFTSSLCKTECMLHSLKPKVKFSVNFFYETSKSKPFFSNDIGGTIHIKTRLQSNKSNKANVPFSLSCLLYGQHPNYFAAALRGSSTFGLFTPFNVVCIHWLCEHRFMNMCRLY